MLRVGLTGGIASGKSVVARRLVELGAALVDADALARDVVAPGTGGLMEVVNLFGPGILDAGGALDRAALGEIVFQNRNQLERLNDVVHPLVRFEAARRIAAAPPDAVVVQDIPLLVETSQEADFHLVIVVHAPEEVRLERMQAKRNMSRAQALDRIRAQAGDSDRAKAADVVIDNAGPLQDTLAAVEELWKHRLVPFEANVRAAAPAERSGPAKLAGYDSQWPDQARRLAARLRRAGGEEVLSVDHIGSTSIAGMAAKDVLDLQVTVADLAVADTISADLAAAGFPRLDGQWADTPVPCEPDPRLWQKRLHGNADPGRAANIHIREQGSPGALYALAFRNWLRADAAAAASYLAEKRRLAQAHAGDAGTGGYAHGKEPWYTEYAYPRLSRWLKDTHPESSPG